MPLARILTLHPDDTANLIQQLERLGFAVEVASPNQQNLDPADLEIEFAICDQQQVIARAGAIANQLQAEIVVFPGAIPPVPRPLPIREQLAAGVPKEEAPEEEPVENAPSPELVPQFQTDDSRASLPELAGVWLDGLSQKVRHSGRRTALGLKRVQSGISSALAGVGNRAAEYRERMKTRAAELRVAREQRRAEAVLRRAEATRQAALLEQEERRQAEIAAAARQQEETRLQAENEKRAEMERAHVAEQVAIQQQSSAKVQEHITQFPAKQKQPRPVRTSQLRGVFTGAIAASILFVIGMLLANFTPTSPFSSSGSNGSVDQQVPFGPTTLHGPPGATLGGQAASNAVRAGNTLPRQAAPAQPKPQPARGKAPAKWRRFRRSASRRADSGGDDVVVRHFGPQSPSQPHAQQAGLKHYSDMQ